MCTCFGSNVTEALPAQSQVNKLVIAARQLLSADAAHSAAGQPTHSLEAEDVQVSTGEGTRLGRPVHYTGQRLAHCGESELQ